MPTNTQNFQMGDAWSFFIRNGKLYMECQSPISNGVIVQLDPTKLTCEKFEFNTETETWQHFTGVPRVMDREVVVASSIHLIMGFRAPAGRGAVEIINQSEIPDDVEIPDLIRFIDTVRKVRY